MCKFSSKSGGVPFQPLGDLTWNDPSVKSCNVCTFIAFRKKTKNKKVHFSQFLKDPLQFIKITLHWLHQLC